ncbi:hypothetical protein IU510_30075 [Nocardia cyriacigeorgica]|uniref:hypothetical protein n=1 Tax=Nocardia cyriacigeorgica TaxID=135487 RepID=UPI000318144E|nr:hypothetical protein [Nocardia cyriacigeorgica]MBF6102269.1 hypothetical protein [Nocardia cyriacigeorgica]
MNFEVGSLIKVVAGGVSVFRVLEIGVDGNPDMALVQSVEDQPGVYPWRTELSLAVPADLPPSPR